MPRPRHRLVGVRILRAVGLCAVSVVALGLQLSEGQLDDPRSWRPLLVAGAGVVVVLAVVAGFVWFLSGNPDEKRNTSGFAPPAVTRASFCDGLAGFQADVGTADPSAAPSVYVGQVRTAADRLRSAGTPADMPADAQAPLTAYLQALLQLPDTATARDVNRLRSGGTQAERKQRRALDSYLATECPSAGG